MSRILRAEPLSADAFRPFGEVIEPDNASEIRLINNGTTTRFHDIAPVEVGEGRALISIFRGKPFALPLAVAMMERHPLGSQAFIPLEGRPFLVLVSQDEAGRPGRPLAFLCDGSKGVSYAPNVWHHPLVALGERSDFLVVDRGGPGDNLEEFVFEEPYSVESSAR